ncbi:Inositol 1,4,5-trisphosphate receptor type 2 [Saguinus oedipus]|uniref:Inositol 1,4,5-trisphosphate receptor type 2 n=1 Tax=Saguinus oedipus TaxID=9490 RepID=A0ABQ9UXF8_SAGOE|nr:Inositol 1,4,5-trisphosphate receptor type 2 [Saguinus oedipus]
MSMPDVPASIHPSKQGSPAEHEDVTVMDTKLKIIEILQKGNDHLSRGPSEPQLNIT